MADEAKELMEAVDKAMTAAKAILTALGNKTQKPPSDLNPMGLPQDTPLLVSDELDENWELKEPLNRYLKEIEGKRASCYQDGKTSWNTTQSPARWEYWKLALDAPSIFTRRYDVETEPEAKLVWTKYKDGEYKAVRPELVPWPGEGEYKKEWYVVLEE